MAAIRGKDTKPEIAVRSMLDTLKVKYELHRSDLPGKPDIGHAATEEDHLRQWVLLACPQLPLRAGQASLERELLERQAREEQARGQTEPDGSKEGRLEVTYGLGVLGRRSRRN